MSTRNLVRMAIYLALFLVLDLVANTFGLFRMPQGGSLGLGVIALLLASYDLGWKNGLLVSLLSIVLMYFTGQVWFVAFGQYLLDYVLAFGVYGLAVLFPTFNRDSSFPIMSGILITNALRLFFSFLAGIIYYGVTPWASLLYQASYMVPTTVLTFIIVPLIYVRLKKVDTR